MAPKVILLILTVLFSSNVAFMRFIFAVLNYQKNYGKRESSFDTAPFNVKNMCLSIFAISYSKTDLRKRFTLSSVHIKASFLPLMTLKQ